MTTALDDGCPAIIIVLNPAARNRAAAGLEAPLRRWVADRGDAVLVVSRSPDDTVAALRRASGARLVVGAGGDGTANAVVNGLMALPEHARPALGVLPAGSGNDFARLTGLAGDPLAALERVVAGDAEPMDVGRCNGRWFINAFSVGLDARVAERATHLKAETGRAGLPVYLAAVWPTLLHELAARDVAVAFDGGEAFAARVTLMAVTNGRSYGGGFRVAPNALADDGLLDTVYVDEMGLVEALWRLPLFVIGRHTRMRPVHMGRHAGVRIEAAEELPAQVDGEVSRGRRFEIGVSPSALRVVRPAGPR